MHIPETEAEKQQQGQKNLGRQTENLATQLTELFNRIQHPLGKEDSLPKPNFGSQRVSQ